MLPYTAEVLFASFEQYNHGLWPAQLLAVALAFVALPLCLRPGRHGQRVILALLAAGWLWTGIGYHGLHFAHLNFAAPAYAGLFVLQGLLFAWGAVRGGPAFRFRPDSIGWSGLAIAIAGLIAWPLADAAGHGWQAVRLVGLAPAPTAVFTLGLLLLIDGRIALRLALVPLLWTLVGGASAWVLAIPQDLVLPVVGLAGVGLILWTNRRRGVAACGGAT